MKGIIFFILMCCLSSLYVAGQDRENDIQLVYDSYSEQYEIVDTAYIEVVYAHSMFDPVKKQKEIVYEILSLGDSYSRYTDYISYKEDSVNNSNAGEKYWFNDWLNGPHKDLLMTYGRSRERVLKNYKNSTHHFDGFIATDRYYYEEPMHQMEWSLGDETRQILGYVCRKAVCRWRGREWTAWYSELPYSDGPWIFGGLPGLIMELTDAAGEHKIRAKGIKRDIYPFGLRKNRSDFRTKRERYRTNLEDYIENSGKRLMESGTVISGMEKRAKKPRRLFYCPLELE